MSVVSEEDFPMPDINSDDWITLEFPIEDKEESKDDDSNTDD